MRQNDCRRFALKLSIVFFYCFLTGAALADACVDCHKNPEFRVQNPKLFQYYNEWMESAHKKAGVTCASCHGGHPDAKTKQQAHDGGFLPSNPQSNVYYKNLPKTCGTCHTEEYRNFVDSKHHRSLQNEEVAPHCGTCHGSINSKAYYTSIVRKTCNTCHNDDNPELPMISEQAQDILQRLNMSKGYLGWTEIYYAERKWPAKAEELKQDYKRLAESWHNFKLNACEQDSIELLARLRAIYAEAAEEIKSKKAQ